MAAGESAEGTGRVDQGRGGLDIGDAAMLAVVLMWAANNIVVKGALAELDPLAYVVGRFVIVVTALGIAGAASRRVSVPERADWPRFLFVALTGFALYNALFTTGLDHTSVFSVALLVSLGPVFTMVMAWALRLERVRLGQWLGAAMAVGGVALFVEAKASGGGAYNPFGDLLSLVAAACFAGYTIATRPLVVRYGPTAVTGWATLLGLAMILPVAWRSVRAQDWAGLHASTWFALFYAGLVSLLVGYSLWTWAIRRRGVGRTTPYLFLIPVVTGVFSAFAFGERFGPLKLAGAGLVLAGTATVRLAAGQPTPARPETIPEPASEVEVPLPTGR